MWDLFSGDYEEKKEDKWFAQRCISGQFHLQQQQHHQEAAAERQKVEYITCKALYTVSSSCTTLYYTFTMYN